MSDFQLHPRLAADTDVIGDLPLCRVLLAKEDIGPWIILVPRKTDLREIHHLPLEEQQQLMRESCRVAEHLEKTTQAQKINIGALGNLVPQLHLHHVARFESDCAWPGPIWGNTKGVQRESSAQGALVEAWKTWLENISL